MKRYNLILPRVLNPGGGFVYNRTCRHILLDDDITADFGSLADCDIAQNLGARSYQDMVFNRGVAFDGV